MTTAAGKHSRCRVAIASIGFRSVGLFALANGEIAIEATETTHFLVFDPGREKFRAIPHPEGRFIAMIAPRRNGTLRASTLSADRLTNRLEIYDSISFRTILELRPKGRVRDLR
jgi:hypothetical protein